MSRDQVARTESEIEFEPRPAHVAAAADAPVHPPTASPHPVADGTSPPTPTDVPPEWLDTHLSTVFSRWHPHLSPLQAATAELVIAAAGIRPGMTVLDVGSGSGVPALTVADRVGPTGRVVATDPSPLFATACAANAQAAGLTNLDVVQVSAAALPFPPATFDAATCHMGAMFFADLRAGLARILATLRPGARAAFVAWGPDADNTFIPTFWAAARPHLPPEPSQTTPAPPPDPDAPRPTRFAESGALSRALADAGFSNVREESPLVDLVWPDDPASLTRFWLDLSRVETRVDPSRHDALRADVEAAYARFADRDTVRMPVRVVVASGAA